VIDPLKTLDDIQQAADDLKQARNRWQEQILLEEEIRQLLSHLDGKKNGEEKTYPIFILYRDQLRELEKRIYNRGELIEAGYSELLQSHYQNMERANALYLEIDQFLVNLPGVISRCGLSNYSSEMQSRILHLTVLQKMCQEKESLTEHAMGHMERFVDVHKNVLQRWIENEKFSCLTFYDLIPKNVDYPTWLVKEHDLFLQKGRDIKRTLWETKYQLLRNEELSNARGQQLEKLVVKTEMVVDTTEAFADGAEQFHRGHSLAAQVSYMLGITSSKKKSGTINGATLSASYSVRRSAT
jgi:hypothetical protein